MLSNKSAVSWEEGQSYFQAMRLDTRVESNYSGGNGNRGEIGFAYFLAILPFYEKILHMVIHMNTSKVLRLSVKCVS